MLLKSNQRLTKKPFPILAFLFKNFLIIFLLKYNKLILNIRIAFQMFKHKNLIQKKN